MRSSFIVALGLSAMASANVLFPRVSGYPACSDPCFVNVNYFGCSSTDFTCICTNHQFLDTSTQCFYDNCPNPADLEEAFKTADAACAAAGVKITSTYTPTQSRTQSVSQTSSATGSVSTTASGNGTVTSTGSATGSGTSTGAAPTSSTGAAVRLGSSTGALAMVGAAVLGALAL